MLFLQNTTWFHLSAPESEFCAVTTGGAHVIHTKNIFTDVQVDVIVRLDTDSTSAPGICRRRGVRRLRHLHNKELWLQDQVAARNVELVRVQSEDNDAVPNTKYLERDRCDKDGDVVRRAWVGEQLTVVSGTEVLIGEDLTEGQSWTISVVLLVRVGVVLLSCACAVFDPHLPTGSVHVTREKAIEKQRRCMSPRTKQDDDLDHVNERTWVLSWYFGDQLSQLMVLNTRSLCGKLAQFLRHIAIMSENQTNVCCNSRVCCGIVSWTASGDDYLYQSKAAICSRKASCETEFARATKKLVVLSSREPH